MPQPTPDQPAPNLATEAHVLLAVRDFGDDPAVVTAMLGLQPTEAWPKGPPISRFSLRPFRRAGWCFHSPLEPSCDPIAHLEALLQLLEPHSEQIRECAARYTARINCCLFHSTDLPPSFEIPGSVVARIASMHLGLLLDTRFQR